MGEILDALISKIKHLLTSLIWDVNVALIKRFFTILPDWKWELNTLDHSYNTGAKTQHLDLSREHLKRLSGGFVVFGNEWRHQG